MQIPPSDEQLEVNVLGVRVKAIGRDAVCLAFALLFFALFCWFVLPLAKDLVTESEKSGMPAATK
jgi:hypothetical protein